MKLKRIAAVILALLCVTALFAGCIRIQIPDLTNTEPTQQITAETQTKAPEGEEPTQTRAASPPETQTKETKSKASAASRPETQTALDKNGSYYSRDDVALYIHTFGHLPSNFLTKQQSSAATGSATMKVCCLKSPAATTLNATSTRRARRGAAASGSSFPPTV